MYGDLKSDWRPFYRNKAQHGGMEHRTNMGVY